MTKKKSNTLPAQITNLAKDIEDRLAKLGQTDATLRFQIEQVATDIIIRRQIQRELLALESVVIREEGSQGQIRTSIHPLSAEYREYGRRVQDGLDKLRMNLKSKTEKAGAADAADEFLKGLNR